MIKSNHLLQNIEDNTVNLTITLFAIKCDEFIPFQILPHHCLNPTVIINVSGKLQWTQPFSHWPQKSNPFIPESSWMFLPTSKTFHQCFPLNNLNYAHMSTPILHIHHRVAKPNFLQLLVAWFLHKDSNARAKPSHTWFPAELEQPAVISSEQGSTLNNSSRLVILTYKQSPQRFHRTEQTIYQCRNLWSSSR